jgi:hypothetical protein
MKRSPEAGHLRRRGRGSRGQPIVVFDTQRQQHGRQFILSETNRISFGFPPQIVDFKTGQLFQVQPWRLNRAQRLDDFGRRRPGRVIRGVLLRRIQALTIAEDMRVRSTLVPAVCGAICCLMRGIIGARSGSGG